MLCRVVSSFRPFGAIITTTALRKWLTKVEEGVIGTDGRGASTRNAEHDMIDYI